MIFDITGEKASGSQDSLSNLLRGNFLIRKIKNSIKSAEGRNGKGGLVYIEIDNFKNLVSSYGGKMGDIILKLVFQSINDVISTNDELVKLVGDKFIILINEFNTIDEVEEICNKIFKNHKQPLIIGNNLINIVFNVGVSIFPDDSTDVDELIQISKFTKEQSKVKGKNILTFFGKKESEVFYRKEIIERELSNGIPNKEFHLCYQPRFEVSSNKIAGIEVLLRWNNKKVGNISPGEFISIAEKNGFIIEIGEWVLEESLKVASMWLSSGYEFKAISVNISLVQLTNKTFKNKLINLCKKHQIPHSILEIEIAERVLMEICDTNIKIINELIEEGFRISLDDFGTGYSNISSLLDIHCSSLKIDKSIIDKIGKDRNKLAIKSIIDLKEDLNYEVIAEGVETKEQVDILTDLGCNIIQGYYFSKPLSEKEIENLLQATSCLKKLIKD